MDEETLKKYRKAGKIAAEAREKSKNIIKKGKTFLEAAEEIEQFIRDKGGNPSFPVNLSINNEAAHYTPEKNSNRIFNEEQILKVDIGVHIDGYVGGDTAYTIDFTENNSELVEASKRALENAISVVRAGRKTKEIGKEIQETIESKGFRPIRNLTGHGLGRWTNHTDPNIPNIESGKEEKLKEGMIIAIEPFASTGEGRVKSGKKSDIYTYKKKVQTRNKTAREITKIAEERYKGLCFAERWINEDFNELKLKMALKELVNRESLKKENVLKDNEGSLVSQAEKTVKVEKDGCEVLTD